MAVYVNNITINTGEYFSRDFYLDNVDGTPLNLVGYAASSYIRKHPESLNPTAKFNVGFIDRANGRIRVSLASTVTKTIKPGRYVYDVLFVDNTSKKSIVIEGNVLATEDISTGCQFIKTEYLYSQVGVIPEGTTSATPQITVNDVEDYGVVHMGVNFNECSQFASGISPTRILLDNSTTRQQIIDYIELGGVVWLNVEWWNGSPSGSGCSNRTNINTMLALLGTEIRAVNDVGFVGTATRSTNSIVVNSGFPATQSNNASVIFSGGTPVYLGGTDVITAYEKIGNGILYVSGDSNTFNGPSYPSSYYDALRALVLNT
jgi:hypothetical protein